MVTYKVNTGKNAIKSQELMQMLNKFMTKRNYLSNHDRVFNLETHSLTETSDAAQFYFYLTHLLKDFLSGLPFSPGGLSNLLTKRQQNE